MSVTAIIPNWNGQEHLVRLLGSCASQGFTRLLVVDNGSSDGSAAAAGRLGASVLRLESNQGFAAAVNAGLRQAASEYVAILNNDVTLGQDWLEQLLQALAREPDAWFATGKIVSDREPTRLDGTFDLTTRAACSWRAGYGQADSPYWDEPRRISSAPLTAALLRRELFARVGGLDERFESYLEDVDFGLRCARAGYAGLYVPAARARHRGSATLGVWHPETVRLVARNQVYLIAKHFPPGWGWRWGWPVLVGQLLWGVVTLRHSAFLPWLRGKRQAIGAYRRLRRERAMVTGAADDISALLGEQEALIREIERRGEFNAYWKIYFALTR